MNKSLKTSQIVSTHLLENTEKTSDSLHLDNLADLLKAAGDPLRLEILRVLRQDSFGVLELCQIFSIKQSSMSHHLKVLASAGLLSSRREANSIFYRRAYCAPEHPFGALQQDIFNAVDAQTLSAEIQTQIRQLQQERSVAALHFFHENANKFREQQDLIASYPIYSEQITQLLTSTQLNSKKIALEIGPGEGEFLSVLANEFSQVIALDISQNMLDKARTYADSKKIRNIEFILGDTQSLATHQIHADCIVANMVLHHTASPAEVFQDLSDALNTGGALLICDLCRHEQTWARDACGDLWQGFDPEEISRWAQTANLMAGQSIYFALRNGFQIQLRQFFK
jgi:ubiquinone/menaquinone biosynthesis C-methylase UbiE/DNA-binding transcriptional ArsR family regulator